MEFIVDDKVKELGVKILGLKIENMNNSNSNLDDFNTWREKKIKELITKYKDYDIKNDKIIEGFYTLHEKVGVPRRKTYQLQKT